MPDAATLIGVSGGIAGGKTTVAKMLAQKLNGIVISADVVAHDLLANDDEIRRLIAAEWGAECLDEQGNIARNKLGAIVFNNAENVAILNRITHPRIVRRIEQQIEAARQSTLWIIIDAPLLFEVGMQEQCDITIFVFTSFDVRARRARSRGWDIEELRRRESHQISPEIKSKLSAYVVNNDGKTDETERQVESIVEDIKRHRRKAHG